MANPFTPEEVSQILEAFFDAVGTRQYIGARYVPIFGRKNETSIEWNNSEPYEPLTVVLYQGNSYTSRQYVPSGVDISNTDYWVLTFNFNAQVEAYRREVSAFDGRITQNESDIDALQDNADNVNAIIPSNQFTTSNTVKEYIDAQDANMEQQILDSVSNDYIPFPIGEHSKYGTVGQVLGTLLNGQTQWQNPITPTDEQAEQYISQWLDDHPEATTTVADSSLNLEKFTNTAFREIVKFMGMSQTIATDTYNNLLSNLKPNTFSWCSSTWFNDFPSIIPEGAAPSACWIISLANNQYDRIDVGVQFAIGWSGTKIAMRNKFHNQAWTNWKRIDSIDAINNYKSYTNYVDATNNLNDLTSQGFYYGAANSNPLNSPDAENTSAFIIQVLDESSVLVQELTYITNEYLKYKRIKIGSADWGSWVALSVADNSITKNKIDFDDVKLITDMGSVIPVLGENGSIDDLTERGIWYIGSPTNITDLPINPPLHILVMKTPYVSFQYIFSDNTGRFMTRVKVGTNEWGEWHEYYEIPHNKTGMYYAFGDSTTKGQLGGESGSTIYGYPKITADYLGMNVSNLGVGGQGLCKDWNTINSTIDAADMSDASLITVGWAYNDGTTWSTLNRGNYQSIDDTTVIGHYYLIMKKLQEKCPTAQLVLVTGYGSPSAVDGHATLNTQFTGIYTFADQSCTVREFYDELEKMCHYNSWPCVNQANGCAFNKFNASRLIGDQIHPTREGYWVYGNNLAAQISKYYANIEKRGF